MLTQARLKEVVIYEPSTGVFTRIGGKDSRWFGRKAGTVHSPRDGGTKYINIRIDGAIYKAHRLVWLYVHGHFPAQMIDHIDGNGLNNRLCNLRECDRIRNMWNRGRSTNNKSGEKNVSFHKGSGTWHVRFRIQGANRFFGSYTSFEEAASVARCLRSGIHGAFANHG